MAGATRNATWARPFGPIGGLIILLAGVVLAGGPDREGPTGGQGAGRLVGTVMVGPDLSTERVRFNLYPDLISPSNLPPASTEPQTELKNVVVYFETVPAGAGRPAGTAAERVMKQEGLRFVPHVLAVEKGASVAFPNGDPIFHNVFSLSRNASFDLGRYPQDRSKSVRFDETGIVRVFCHIHSDMSGVILVLDNPFFAVPDDQGRYQVDGVPPGSYKVVAWHERARTLEARVRIEAEKTTVLDLEIPLVEATGG